MQYNPVFSYVYIYVTNHIQRDIYVCRRYVLAAVLYFGCHHEIFKHSKKLLSLALQQLLPAVAVVGASFSSSTDVLLFLLHTL